MNEHQDLPREDLKPDDSLAKAVQAGHEGFDLDAKTILWVGASLFLLAVGSLGLVAWMLSSRGNSELDRIGPPKPERMAADPGVNPNQTRDRRQIEAGQQQQLNSYGWVDETHLAARIPIARAMQLLAERKMQVDWSSSQKPLAKQKPAKAEGGKP